ncbi:MAG: peroxiredoxin [Candidatus Bathyarchaeota archaeon]|jgi:peroxiredoxin Q/BCP|nr:peroxiredoxin [Candidatus Bathyarchaeota archaeon]
MVNVKVGEVAPDFTIPDQDGKPVTLSAFRGKVVVLYFYPKDFTSGCTKEACHFRDSYEDFTEAGVEVIGVSADSQESHRKFRDAYLLPFSLLSDEKGEVKKLYGVSGSLLPARVTFVIDKDGIVRNVFSSRIDMKAHVDEAMKIIKSLS